MEQLSRQTLVDSSLHLLHSVKEGDGGRLESGAQPPVITGSWSELLAEQTGHKVKPACSAMLQI